jgi:hypothetical protein
MAVMAGLHLLLGLAFLSGPVSGKLKFQIGTEANPKVFANYRANVFDEKLNLTMDVLKVLEGKIMVNIQHLKFPKVTKHFFLS